MHTGQYWQPAQHQYWPAKALVISMILLWIDPEMIEAMQPCLFKVLRQTNTPGDTRVSRTMVAGSIAGNMLCTCQLCIHASTFIESTNSTSQDGLPHLASSHPLLCVAASCLSLTTACLACCNCCALLRCNSTRAAHHSSRVAIMSNRMPKKAPQVRLAAAEPAGQWETQEQGNGAWDCEGQKCLLGHCVAVKGSGQ